LAPRPTRPDSSLPGRPSLVGGGARRARATRSVDELADGLYADPRFGPRLSGRRELPPRPGTRSDWPAGVDPRISALFARRGIERPYAHQAQAIELALAGRDVLVTTPTASGKTLGYTVPVLEALLESQGAARALWMFPTKALSQDQSASLNGLLRELGQDWHSFTYDGDTPPSVRRTLRERGHVVLTNPWMLHAGILPNHPKWADLFRGLTYVVIDELHTLSGIFGSNVANVLRRLSRVAAHYGARPRFLLSSATLRDPAAHAEALIGRPAALVTEDGSPAGKRVVAVLNPPLVDAVAGLRGSALEEARLVAERVVGPGHQTIFFCNRRTAVEVLTRYLKEAAADLGLEPAEVRGYRGGYLPGERREIEEGLRSGAVKVVVSTNALELGIDVGRLDVAVLVGYPGSQASFWQRAGRVGRRGGTSLTLLVARADPVDQYLAANPDYLFDAPRERLGLDPDHLLLLAEQLKCAAFELPFRRGPTGAVEGFGGSPHVASILDYLAGEAGLLQRDGDSWHWIHDSYPAQNVSLAGNEPDNVLVLDAETKLALGEVDREGSITSVHEGAIYQVQGDTWKIERFDYPNRRAYARAVESDYFTEAETDTEVRVLALDECLARGGAGSAGAGGVGAVDYAVWRGEVHVTTLATMYKKIRFYTRENVGADVIQLPPEERDTEAALLTLSDAALAGADGGVEGGVEPGAAWHGFGALLRRVAPLFLRCQPQDLGLATQVRSPHFGRPAVVLYERMSGGSGLSRLFLEAHRDVFRAAEAVRAACPCQAGCPACVGPSAEVGARGKALIGRILAQLLAGPPPEPTALAPATDASTVVLPSAAAAP
jgi:DEAD/DEAH box helicase domain-containing protein